MLLRSMPLLLLLATGAARAEELTLPEARSVDYYAKMLEKSPFALATAAAPPPAEPTASFAADWILTGLAKLPDGNGGMTDYVSIRSRDQRLVFSLVGQNETTSSEPDAQGVTIARVERSAKPADEFVELRKGTETARIKFDESSPAPSEAPTGGSPAVVPQAGNNPGVVPTNVNAANGSRRPVLGGAGQPVVPRGRPGMPPGMNGMGNGQPPIGTAPAPTVRRRTIINR